MNNRASDATLVRSVDIEALAPWEYLSFRSPPLKPYHPKLRDDKDDDACSETSSTDGELDLNAPWILGLQPKSRDGPTKRKRSGNANDKGDSPPRRPGRKDRALIDSLEPPFGSGIAEIAETTALPEDPNPPSPRCDFSNPSLQKVTLRDLAMEALRSVSIRANSTGITVQRRVGNTRAATNLKRLTLPIVIEIAREPINIVAYPDTGSSDNIISLSLAERLGIPFNLNEDRKMFSLANGKEIEALGKCSLTYRFGSNNLTSIALHTCTAYIFKHLIVPILMGAGTLQATETFTTHRYRLVEEIVPSVQSFRVNAVGKPNRGLICRLNSYVGVANADTGSDLDVISPKFAAQRGLQIQQSSQVVEFADGSTEITRGVVETSFSVGNVHDYKGFDPIGPTLALKFYILDGLTSDILVGQNTISELRVFNLHEDIFINSLPAPGLSDCCIIRFIGRAERIIRSVFSPLLPAVESPRSDEAGADADVSYQEMLNTQRQNAQQENIRNPGGYVCTVPGCNAPPFKTQKLLNSHANVHSSARPHYCPFPGCAHAEGGEGFRYLHEMIRHCVVHDSTENVCPFCPDRDHNFPRPDDLQRHIRIHHLDRSKDDPLSQRPDGPSRRRRRRGGT